MIKFYNADEIKFEDHPKFKGVKIAKLVGKADNSPIGVSILHIEPSVEIPIHIHEESVDSIYCLDGCGVIYDGNSWRDLKPGDYCFVPKNEEHGVKNSGSEILKLFIVHSPALF